MIVRGPRKNKKNRRYAIQSTAFGEEWQILVLKKTLINKDSLTSEFHSRYKKKHTYIFCYEMK